MTLVPGDPGSLSACARTLGACSRRLGDLASQAGTSVESLAEGWPGRVSVGVRRRGEILTETGAQTAHELERVARLLQDHATDLADLVSRARALEERATVAGLEVREGRIRPVLGLLTPADATADHARTRAAAILQGELDLVSAQHRRRRDFVLGALRESGARLAARSQALRHG